MQSGTKAHNYFPACVYTNKEAKIPLQHPCTVLEVVIIRSKYAHFGWSLFTTGPGTPCSGLISPNYKLGMGIVIKRQNTS